MMTPLHQSARRERTHFPFRARWQIVKYRSRVTWGQWWVDVLYLVRG